MKNNNEYTIPEIIPLHNLPETLLSYYKKLIILNSWSFQYKTVALSIINTIENVNISNFCAIVFIELTHIFNARI